MKWVAYLVFLLCMIATYGLLHAGLDLGGVPMFPVVLLLSFIATLVHELGHAGAAAASGARVREIVVVPFSYRLRERRVRMAVLPKGSEVGGYVSYSLDRIDARRKHVLIAFAGPAANVALSALIWGGMAAMALIGAGAGTLGTLPPDADVIRFAARQGHAVPALLNGLAMLSIGAAIANLIPYRGSDGAAILRGLTGKAERTR